MRRRILIVVITAAVVATFLFSLPLAFAARQLFVTNEQNALEREALRAIVSVDPAFARGDPVELPAPLGHFKLALYDARGHLVAGQQPPGGALEVGTALQGTVAQGNDRGILLSVVPVSSQERVIGVMAAWTTQRFVWQRTLAAWTGMLALGLVAVLFAFIIARRQARQLSEPLERLATSALALGDGDFAVRAFEFGVPEINATAMALNTAAGRIEQLVAREREFAANASHQLRNPLTALRLALESALNDPGADISASARSAVAITDQIESTIDELLLLAHPPGGQTETHPECSPIDLIGSVADRWQSTYEAAGRRLELSIEPSAPAVRCSATAIDQVLDALIHNALVHGAGTVEVAARESAGALAIDVRDEGHEVPTDADIFLRGWSSTAGNGIGLSLGRHFAESQDGRLILSRTQPATTFTLLLPNSRPDQSAD